MVIKWNGGPHRAARSEHRQMEPVRPHCLLFLPVDCPSGTSSDTSTRISSQSFCNVLTRKQMSEADKTTVHKVSCARKENWVYCKDCNGWFYWSIINVIYLAEQREKTLYGIFAITYTTTDYSPFPTMDISSLCHLSVWVMMSGLSESILQYPAYILSNVSIKSSDSSREAFMLRIHILF